jgi:hypothetical protein
VNKKIKRADLIYLAAIIRDGASLARIQYTANQILGVGACGDFDRLDDSDYIELVKKYDK